MTDLTEEIPQHEDDLFRYLSVPYRTCASEHGFKADVIVSCYHCGTVTALCGECQRPSSYVFESLLILPKCGDIVLRDRVSFIPVP